MLRLEYSVDTLDKTPLLPAGAVLTRGTLEKLALLDALGYFRRHDPYTYRHSLRTDRPSVCQCVVSVEKRGKPPEGNLYGVFAEDGSSADPD